MIFNLPMGLDFLGVGFFAMSGAVAAIERRADIVTFLFFGAVTGIGGGTLRDLLIGVPVFWVREPAYLIVCALASAAVWLLGGRGVNHRLLLWLDGIGLAVYAVVGAAKAQALNLGDPVCITMGVLTASFGGVLRDVLAAQPSVLLRREIYITAAIVAAAVFVEAGRFGATLALAAGLGVGSGLLLRWGALARGWTLPAFRSAQ